MPVADQATSMPRKYLSFPKSFIGKVVRRNCLTWLIAVRVSEVMMTSVATQFLTHILINFQKNSKIAKNIENPKKYVFNTFASFFSIFSIVSK
jgi:hypothetical protein